MSLGFLGRLAMAISGAKMLGEALSNSPAHAREANMLGSGDPIEGREYDVNTIEDRVRLIADNVIAGREYPNVIEAARSVVARKCGGTWCIAPRDWEGELDALFYAVRDQMVRYTADPRTKDTYAHPRATLKMAAGDCAHLASVFGAMAEAIGYSTSLVVIQEKGEDDWNHIYNRVETGPQGQEIRRPYDLSVTNPPGWELPSSQVTRKRVFLIPG